MTAEYRVLRKRNLAIVVDGSGKPSLSAKIEAVQKLTLFFGISPADCAAIISLSHESRLARRQNLFSIGDPVVQTFLILSGSVKMTQVGFRGGEAMLRICGVGDLVGTFDQWLDTKHNSTAQVTQIGSALAWDSVIFAKLLDAFPPLRRNAFHLLEERLQELEQRFRELSMDDVPSRLSSELIRLSKRFGSGTKENGEIHLSQTDLAQLTGTTVPTVSRLLGRWERLGIVSVRREAVQVHDLAALAQFSWSQ